MSDAPPLTYRNTPLERLLRETIEAGFAETQDEQTRALVRQAQVERLPVLFERGWQMTSPGGDGLGTLVHRRRQVAAVHSIARQDDGHVWAQVMVSCRHGRIPSLEAIQDVFRDVCGPDAVGVVALNAVGPVAHVWCRLTRPLLDFTLKQQPPIGT